MKKWIFAIAAAAVILAAVLLTRTPSDGKVDETLPAEQNMTLMIEGLPEEISHSLESVPAEIGENNMEAFTIYVDEECYVMTVEDGVTYIRAIVSLPTEQDIRDSNSRLLEGLSPEEEEAEVRRMLAEQLAYINALPPCEIEIRHLPDTAPAAAAAAARSSMAAEWDVSEMMEWSSHDGLLFQAFGGTAWDSPCQTLYFTGDGGEGAYQLTVRYFVEAAEGHGSRLKAMLETFALAG